MAIETIPFRSTDNSSWTAVGAATDHEATAVSNGDTQYVRSEANGNCTLDRIIMGRRAKSINSVTLRHESKNEGVSGSRLRPRIRYNNAGTQTGSNATPTSSYVVYDSVVLTNQETAAAFTRDEINGIGTTGINNIIYNMNNAVVSSFLRMTYCTFIVDFEPAAQANSMGMTQTMNGGFHG